MGYLKKHKFISIAAVVVIMAVVALVVWNSDKKTTSAVRAVNNIKVAVIQTATIPEVFNFSGTIHAVDEAKVAAQVAGTILSLTATPGARVNRGQVIARIDGRTADSQANAAQHNSNQAEQAVKVAGEQLKLAKITLGRYSELFNQGVISPHDFDQAKSAYAIADEAYKLALAGAQSAQSNANAVKSSAGYYDVTAPIDGVVALKNIDVGDMVMPGQALFTIEGDGPREVAVFLPETLFSALQIGSNITVFENNNPKPIMATVTEVAPLISDTTRTYKIRARLPADYNTPVGHYVNVAVNSGKKRSALLVPAAAVVERGQLTGVFVITRNNNAVFRILRISDQPLAGSYEIFSGLQPGDKVATSGVDRLADGNKVQS
ncbi:MAG: efflux RND transporter periplasmic adaptor subunit [Negativicutes bacterium]|jgi:RND family efflux transporter MFP subunit